MSTREELEQKIREKNLADDLYNEICSSVKNGSSLGKVKVKGETDYFFDDTTIISFNGNGCSNPDFGIAYCVSALRNSSSQLRRAKYVFNFVPGVRFKEMIARKIMPNYCFENNAKLEFVVKNPELRRAKYNVYRKIERAIPKI